MHLPEKKRDLIHIEFLRIIATYLVLFNHTGIYGFFLYSVEQTSPFYPVYMFMSIACKPAVPLFFMISGALLLGKSESIKEIYRKRVLKYILVLIVISVFYHIYDWQFMGEELDWKQCFLTIYASSASPALWYLYTYIGVLMMLPLLRRLVQSMKHEDYIYMIVCHVVIAGVIPIVQYLASKGTVWLSPDLYTPLFTVNCIFYVITGYYFENVMDEKLYCRKNCIIAACTGILAIVIMCLMTQYES